MLLPVLVAGLLPWGGQEPSDAQDSVRVAAVADAFVDPARPGRRFGKHSRLRLGGDPRRRAYLRFRLRDLPGRVARATLAVYAIDGSSAGFSVRGVTGNWGESRIRHRTAPAPGPLIARSGKLRAGMWKRVDVTALISGNGTFSLALQARSSRKVRLASRESSRPPRLIVETEPATAPMIMAAGRIACDPNDRRFNGGRGTAKACRMHQTSDLLVWNEPFLSAVLPLGDNQYQDGAGWKYPASYGHTWGRVKHLARPVAGNHDHLTPGAAGHHAYFGEAAGHPDVPYYSFDLGAWHLIALDSECEAVGGCGPGSPQQAWLRAELAASTAPCTLAYWHRPLFTSAHRGGDAQVRPLWTALHEAGADVVLNGHQRFYERFGPQRPDGGPDPAHGIVQFNVGTGGKGSLQDWGPEAPNSVVRSRAALGVIELTLRDDGYDWRFVPEAGGKVTDRGSASCHGAPGG